MTSERLLTIALLLCAVAKTWLQAQAHVALTFPRARLLDLDFLDNARTPGPCGMPKGSLFFSYFFFLFKKKRRSIE